MNESGEYSTEQLPWVEDDGSTLIRQFPPPPAPEEPGPFGEES